MAKHSNFSGKTLNILPKTIMPMSLVCQVRKVPRRYELGTGEAEFLELLETYHT